MRLEDLYKEFGWDLYKRFGHAFDAFKIAVTNPEEVLGKYSIREDLMEQLTLSISRKMTPQVRVKWP